MSCTIIRDFKPVVTSPQIVAVCPEQQLALRDRSLAVLGLNTGAGLAEVKDHYHKLILQCHPDKVEGRRPGTGGRAARGGPARGSGRSARPRGRLGPAGLSVSISSTKPPLYNLTTSSDSLCPGGTCYFSWGAADTGVPTKRPPTMVTDHDLADYRVTCTSSTEAHWAPKDNRVKPKRNITREVSKLQHSTYHRPDEDIP